MTPQTVITDARYLINDTETTPRQSDTELLGYFNDGLKEVSTLRPELFLSIGDYVCTPSQSEQALTFADAQSVVQVLAIHGGAALTPFDIPTLDSFSPTWRAATPAAATQWGKYPGDALRFFIYPPAPATAQTLDVQYIRLPAAYAIDATVTDIPASFAPAMVDYVCYRAMSKDDEHSDSGRAVAAYTAFVSKAKGG